MQEPWYAKLRRRDCECFLLPTIVPLCVYWIDIAQVGECFNKTYILKALEPPLSRRLSCFCYLPILVVVHAPNKFILPLVL